MISIEGVIGNNDSIVYTFTEDLEIYNIETNVNYSTLNITVTTLYDVNEVTINGDEFTGSNTSYTYNDFPVNSSGTTTFTITVIAQDNSRKNYIFNLIQPEITNKLSTITIEGVDKYISFSPVTSEFLYNYYVEPETVLSDITMSVESEDIGTSIKFKYNDEEETASSFTFTPELGFNNVDIIVGGQNHYSIGIYIVEDNTSYINTINNKNTVYDIGCIDKVFKYCSVEIDTANNNPLTCCSYTEDSQLFEPSSFEWDKFFGHYPVLFKNGKEIVKINPDNFKKDIFGNTITSSDGDVMIKFPRRGIKIYYKDSTTLVVSMTDNPNDSSYTYYAHNNGTVQKDAFYLGAYKLSLNNGDGTDVNNVKARSISGDYVEIGNISSSTQYYIPDFVFEQYCINNGDGYFNEGFFQRLYIQVMYILKYCNLDSQSTIGAGLVNIGETIYKQDDENVTGYTDEFGMDSERQRENVPSYTDPNYDNQSDSQGDYHVKLFGLEDIWGCRDEYISNIFCENQDAQNYIVSVSSIYNISGSNVVKFNNIDSTSADFIADNYIYLKKAIGNSYCGLLSSVTSDIEDEYFCDKSIICLPYEYSNVKRCGCSAGGDYSSTTKAGIFNLSLDTLKSLYILEEDVYPYSVDPPQWRLNIFANNSGSYSTQTSEPEDWEENWFSYYALCSSSKDFSARLMYL